ncbi:MAG: bifunctional serine/threonine-protein kinase/formylglycine-generating enzyme family protein [Myxococcota bacterium]|nr:bifunctional serine/threonine-protein kinase/formylglycine-generating enzyme family protein [Myxococcota bacterium]
MAQKAPTKKKPDRAKKPADDKAHVVKPDDEQQDPAIVDDPKTVQVQRRKLSSDDLDAIERLTKPSFLEDAIGADAEADLVTVTGTRYDESQELGRGAMGVVHLARDGDLNRQVALKTLLPSEADRPGARARLLREARLGGSLEHPNIIPVYELGRSDDGNPFFTMRRMQGRSLAEILSAQRNGDEEIVSEFGRIRLLTIFIQICMAAEFAHSRGIVHRDIKPGNIMLGDFGEVQLLDWGIARRVDEEEPIERRVLSLTGTPGYMAPEQILMKSDVALHLSDVYALGAILYEMLTLRRPLEDEDPEELMVRCCAEDPVPPSKRTPARGIPVELDEICLMALAREPEQRTPSARQLARNLESFMEGVRERERLEREALQKLLDGQSLTARYEALRQELAFARKEAREIRGEIRPWSGVEHKCSMWDLEDRAVELQEEVIDAFGDAVRAFSGSLDRVPDHSEARLGLAHLWWSRFIDEEKAGDLLGARQSRGMVELYDSGSFAERLRGDGRLTLLTDPTGAEVWIHSYEEKDRVLVAGEGRLLGTTPLRDVAAPMGSHLIILRHEGFPDVRYPVNLGRLQHHEGYVRFYGEDEIGEGLVYIPGGPFLARGGTTEYGDMEELREVVLPDYAIGQKPVTFRDYLAFINDLDSRDAKEAQARIPRTQLDGPLCHRDKEGRFRPTYEILIEGKLREVYPDPEVSWELPVIAVSWDDAQSWCRWESDRRGYEIRLPTESEWEKAARGVDGRNFPWGNAYDATFANWRGARAMYPQLEPPGIYPTDVSPFNVSDMCGGASNWCDGWYKRDQELRPFRGNNWNTATARSMAERNGVFARICTSSLGLRTARTLVRSRSGLDSTRLSIDIPEK